MASDDEIPPQEEALLARVHESLAAARAAEAASQRHPPAAGAEAGPSGAAAQAAQAQYDQDLISLRDEIAEARLEDVAALVAQMERLQGVSLRRAEARAVLVDPDAPYFGHLALEEEAAVPGRAGRGQLARDVLIGRATFVDPARRVSIVDWRNAPVSQLYYRYEEGADYEERFGERDVSGEIRARRTLTIEGGALRRIACPQGVWTRAGGVSGAGGGGGEGSAAWVRADNVPAALAGGEGSAARAGTGTVARAGRGVLGAAAAAGAHGQRLDRHLPEIAALIDPHQFEIITTPRAGVVVIQGGAGSGKTTIGLHRIAYLAYAHPKRFPPGRMLVVTYGSALAAYIGQVLPALGVHGVEALTFEAWARHELRRAIPWMDAAIVEEASPVVARVKHHPGLLALLERRAAAHQGKRTSRAVVELWAEIVTDLGALRAAVSGPGAEAPLPESDVVEAHRQIADRVSALVDREPVERRADSRGRRADRRPDDDDIRGDVGIDGMRTEGEGPVLDLPDVAILLRLGQLVRGTKHLLAHLFVDEAQDLSPLELSVLLGQTTPARSVTLAGDTAQRLFLDNGFHDWRSVLRQIGLAHVAIEPLRIAYRSTREILSLARHAMGPLADPEPPEAPRSGAPVEAHRFPGTGAAVGFLAEALRALAQREPRASVAILARHPEQADRYFAGLRRAEVPALRRVSAQNFAFRPGVEVTEIRQAKGLEFDYVILADANAATFGTDDESRHLFHIAATRAAHQLWLIVTGPPSPLVPAALLQASVRASGP